MGCFAWIKINDDDDDYNAFEYVMVEFFFNFLGFSFMCFYFYSV